MRLRQFSENVKGGVVFDPVILFATTLFLFGACAALFIVDAVGWIRKRCQGSERLVTRGKVELFDDDGEGPYLSAKLPIRGLRKLIDDVNRGRFE